MSETLCLNCYSPLEPPFGDEFVLPGRTGHLCLDCLAFRKAVQRKIRATMAREFDRNMFAPKRRQGNA